MTKGYGTHKERLLAGGGGAEVRAAVVERSTMRWMSWLFQRICESDHKASRLATERSSYGLSDGSQVFPAWNVESEEVQRKVLQALAL